MITFADILRSVTRSVLVTISCVLGKNVCFALWGEVFINTSQVRLVDSVSADFSAFTDVLSPFSIRY